MDCMKEKNLERCACKNEACPRKGVCCQCLSYHLSNRSFPACVFPKEVRPLAPDQSFEAFARLVTAGAI